MGWMGPVVDGREHGGCVVPLIADGAQGAGVSSARVVLLARRPDDGPRNGDRVRPSDHDGSAVTGIQQDSAVIGQAGIVHADTGGWLRCQAIDEAEEVAPRRGGGRLGRRLHLRLARHPVGPGAHVGAAQPSSAAAGPC